MSENESTQQVKSRIKQSHPEAVFATIPKVGLIALGAAGYDDFLTFLSANGANGADKTLVQEQLVIDGLLYPDDKDAKARVRHVLRSMPFLLAKTKLHEFVEECSRKGDVDELELSDEERKELEARHEFGIAGIHTDQGNIVITTNEVTSPFVRVVLNEVQGARKNVGQKIVSAILASLVSPDRDTVESLLRQRPGLIPPLWVAIMSLTGDADVEVEKN